MVLTMRSEPIRIGFLFPHAANRPRRGGSPMRIVRASGSWITVIAVLALYATTASAAFPPRAPQIAVLGGTLQAYLNGADGGINVLTDQLDGQTWTTSVSGNATFTLMIELTGSAAGNNIGVYNAG